jgi:hypothetical protein
LEKYRGIRGFFWPTPKSIVLVALGPVPPLQSSVVNESYPFHKNPTYLHLFNLRSSAPLANAQILLICNRHYFFLTNRMRLCVAYSTREYKITILEGHMHEKEEKYKIKLVWLDWYINTSTNQTRRSVGLGHQRDHRLLTRQGNKN